MKRREAQEIEITIYAKGTEAVEGKCAICGGGVDGGSYCFGCKNFICDNCDNNPEVYELVRHKVTDHHVEGAVDEGALLICGNPGWMGGYDEAKTIAEGIRNLK